MAAAKASVGTRSQPRSTGESGAKLRLRPLLGQCHGGYGWGCHRLILPGDYSEELLQIAQEILHNHHARRANHGDWFG